jgi:hypothetical protein
MGRGLQAMESHLQMLRDLTMDTMGNSLLSDDVTLQSLAGIKHCGFCSINDREPPHTRVEAVGDNCNAFCSLQVTEL